MASKISHAPDPPEFRKARGAFFTPQPIADYLAEWAVEGDPSAVVLDPTCGESVFLEAAGRRLKDAGASKAATKRQVWGVDLHQASVDTSRANLTAEDLGGSFITEDFFNLSTPDKLDTRLPWCDAVIGNPPFVRYQHHIGRTRKRAQLAALEQGVRLSGLASSWAALVVHACGFLKPEGRLAMVLPTELLSVGYAEPIRRWLKRRFKAVHLVMFERLQFADATERVVLVLARGTGGCKAFTLVPVEDAEDLRAIRMFGPNHFSVAPADDGKWTDFLLSAEDRQLLDRVAEDHFVPLSQYGQPTLGTVTGNNDYFALNETTRRRYEIDERHLTPIAPPGSKYLDSPYFTKSRWRELLQADRDVWLLNPGEPTDADDGLWQYIAWGESEDVHLAYKCRVRDPWWKPPVVPTPDLFFTYMSHRYPRLVANQARVSFVNSMHGIRLRRGVSKRARAALPILTLNSLTMLGAEVHGRSYGGGVLKMEPSEAANLPAPAPKVLERAWSLLQDQRTFLERRLSQGLWTSVVKRVDEALLRDACGLSAEDATRLAEAAVSLRAQRMGRGESDQRA